MTMSTFNHTVDSGLLKVTTSCRLLSLQRRRRVRIIYKRRFSCDYEIFDYLNNGDDTVLEKGPLENIARSGLLYHYEHRGFWKCMDTLKDKNDCKNSLSLVLRRGVYGSVFIDF